MCVDFGLMYGKEDQMIVGLGVDVQMVNMVVHHCGNPLCCNPKHLFLGTQYDNLQDASKKGRLGRNMQGEKNGNVKLQKKK